MIPVVVTMFGDVFDLVKRKTWRETIKPGKQHTSKRRLFYPMKMIFFRKLAACE